MKLIVDKMPDEDNPCFFRYRNVEYGMICKLTNHRCSHMERCECLKPNDSNGAKIDTSIIIGNKKNIKFKTGDLAKIVANVSGHFFDIGTIVALEKHDRDYKAIKNGDYWWVIDDDLEPLSDDDIKAEN